VGSTPTRPTKNLQKPPYLKDTITHVLVDYHQTQDQPRPGIQGVQDPARSYVILMLIVAVAVGLCNGRT
jgi:hypothetical protein